MGGAVLCCRRPAGARDLRHHYRPLRQAICRLKRHPPASPPLVATTPCVYSPAVAGARWSFLPSHLRLSRHQPPAAVAAFADADDAAVLATRVVDREMTAAAVAADEAIVSLVSGRGRGWIGASRPQWRGRTQGWSKRGLLATSWYSSYETGIGKGEGSTTVRFYK